MYLATVLVLGGGHKSQSHRFVLDPSLAPQPKFRESSLERLNFLRNRVATTLLHRPHDRRDQYARQPYDATSTPSCPDRVSDRGHTGIFTDISGTAHPNADFRRLAHPPAEWTRPPGTQQTYANGFVPGALFNLKARIRMVLIE
jgi:hypothetical protein